MPRRIVAVTLLLTFTVASCRTWTPLQGIPDPMPDEIRVELVSGEQVELMDARLEADTLVGRVPGGIEGLRLPLGQVGSIESKETRGLAVFVVAVPVAFLTVAFIIACSSSCGIGS